MKKTWLIMGFVMILLSLSVVAQDYSSLNESLAGFWKFDTLQESTGNFIDLSLQGSSILNTTNYQLGNASGQTPNGNTHYINFNSTPQINNLNGSFSYGYWVYPVTEDGSFQRLMTKGDTINHDIISQRRTDNDRLQCGYYDGSVKSVTSTNTLPIGQWTHVTCVYNNATSIEIYLNGIKETLSASSYGTTLNTGSEEIFFGRLLLANTYYGEGNINIDEAFWYNKSLNASEVLDLYNGTTLGTALTYENFTDLSAPPVVTSSIDLLFASTSTPTTYETNFDTGEDLYIYINYTLSNGTIPTNDTAICNITMFDAYLSYDASDQNFTLCGSGCDYTDQYSENISGIQNGNGEFDFVHFNGCHEQLAQGDMIINLTCASGSYQDTILAGELPLCSAGTSFISRNTSVCVTESWINLTLTYDGINGRRKRVTNLDIDRRYTSHTDSSVDGDVIFNATLNLWRQLNDYEYYDIGTKTIHGNCSYTGDSSLDNSKSEQISIDNSAPIITFAELFLPSTTYVLVNGLNVIYEDGQWNWTGSVNDLDGNLDNFSVFWYNSSNDLIYNYTNLTGVTVLGTPNATFIDEANPYNLTVQAWDTEGATSIESILFNVNINATAPTNVTNVTGINSTLTTGSCPTTTPGMLTLALLVSMCLFFIVVGLLSKLSFSGFLGSLMLMVLSWTIYGCQTLFGALTAFMSLMFILYFALRGNYKKY